MTVHVFDIFPCAPPESPRKSMSPFRSTTPKAASPDPLSAGPGETSPKMIPLDIESPKCSSTLRAKIEHI